MELDQPTKRLSENNIGFDFFQKFQTKIILLIIILSIFNLVSINLITFYLLKVTALFDVIIINLIILVCSILETLILVKFILKPLKQLLDTLFPFSQANRSLSKDFNAKQNFDEIIKVIYQLKSLRLNNQPNEAATTSTDYFQNINTGIIVFSPQGQIIYHNNSAGKFIEKGRLIFDYQLNDLTIEDWIKHCQNSTVHANHTWEELSANDSQNKKRWYHIIADFQKGAQAETTLLIADKTKLYHQKQNEFDFISFAAHELRGPITVVRGYLDILSSDQRIIASQELKSVIDRLTVSGNRLSSYVNNILNVAKFDQKHLKLSISEQSIESIFQDIYDDVKLRAQTQNRVLSFEAEPNLPNIACDKSSFSQVLTNLIDNAIKYSNPGGQIKVRSYRKGSYINTEVIDQGIGMPSNAIANLFKRFYRSQRSKDSVGGTGIGLFISKAIIDSHGGYITVDSIYHKGSTFTVGIPIFNQQPTDNQNLIKEQPNSWIKNHGKFSE